jgi:hypothetical protein
LRKSAAAGRRNPVSPRNRVSVRSRSCPAGCRRGG